MLSLACTWLRRRSRLPGGEERKTNRFRPGVEELEPRVSPAVVYSIQGTNWSADRRAAAVAAMDAAVGRYNAHGGWIRHVSGIGDLFQLDGRRTVASASTIRATQGNINILADLTGSGGLTIPAPNNPAEDNRYVRLLSSDNRFTGNLNVLGRFELAGGANQQFVLGPSGGNNAIAGAGARRVLLNGVFQIDLTGASANPGDSWSLVTAANTSYGGGFRVAGFTEESAGRWHNPAGYVFSEHTGRLTYAGNAPPVLAPIADQALPAGQDSLTVPLTATDPDGDPLTLTARAQSLAYVLNQQDQFFTDGNFWENYAGLNERWVQGAGDQWFYLLPTGELYRGDGTPLGTVGSSYWDDPYRLTDAPADQPWATLGIAGDGLTIVRDPAWVSALAITVTVSDGALADSRAFTVTVGG